MSATSSLFKPLRVGEVDLKHRIVLAPLTRFRADKDHVHHEAAVEYYTQRGSTPGTLLITEGTVIHPEAGGYDFVPGIYSDAQIAAWRKVTDAVHAKGSFIFLQLWAIGRQGTAEYMRSQGYPLVSSSDVPFEEGAEAPKPLSKDEIKKFVGYYAQAAKNAVEKAGFDGVEIHGANGYLVDQFLQDTCNKRTDEYGGSVENRSRFGLEVAKACAEAVGEKRVGLRLSPYSTYGGMKMADPQPQFAHFISQLRDQLPSFAYIHMVESRIARTEDIEGGESTEWARELWGKDRVFFSAGGYKLDSAKQVSEQWPNLAVIFGRHFIANPDLPLRLRYDVPLNPYNRSTFYLYGPDKTEGYTDYPTASELVGKDI